MNLSTKKTNAILLSLVILDCVLATVAYGFPNLWFQVFHGVDAVDPQGLLRRAGGSWLAFAVLQFIAWRKWQANQEWLLIVAGVRLSDMFTDWTYLAFAQNLTWFAWATLIVASPTNLWIGCYLIRAFKKAK